jgi:hypothetical protein
MGLTIHYALKSKTLAGNKSSDSHENATQAEQTVFKMRQLALDLPFEEVGDIVNLTGDQCDADNRPRDNDKNEALSWLLIQSGQSVQCPWNKRVSRTISPTHIMAFDTWPGPGCEAANFGLCLYPAEVEWEYDPEDDQRFEIKAKDGWYRFSWDKWKRHCKRTHAFTRSPAFYTEMRRVPTKLAGWRWRSFCKTQYASDPKCGGIPNFLRCHISVITLLDRMAKLPGLKTTVDDEGKYGPSLYSDDWQEAYAAGRKPTYRRHKGQYNPAALAKEVGEWNEMIAGMSGAISDALAADGIEAESPIKDFADFERLEFKGRNLKYLEPFLAALKSLSTQVRSE